MHFPPKFMKKRPPTFSMVHLLYRLYGVDAPGHTLRPRTYQTHFLSSALACPLCDAVCPTHNDILVHVFRFPNSLRNLYHASESQQLSWRRNIKRVYCYFR